MGGPPYYSYSIEAGIAQIYYTCFFGDCQQEQAEFSDCLYFSPGGGET
jgi:hypothetical protein